MNEGGEPRPLVRISRLASDYPRAVSLGVHSASWDRSKGSVSFDTYNI